MWIFPHLKFCLDHMRDSPSEKRSSRSTSVVPSQKLLKSLAEQQKLCQPLPKKKASLEL